MVKKWFKKSFSPVSQKPTGSFHYQTFFHNLNRASNNFLCRDHSHLAVPKKFCLNLILHHDKQKSKCQCRKSFHFKIFSPRKIPNRPITGNTAQHNERLAQITLCAYEMASVKDDLSLCTCHHYFWVIWSRAGLVKSLPNNLFHFWKIFKGIIDEIIVTDFRKNEMNMTPSSTKFDGFFSQGTLMYRPLYLQKSRQKA